MEVQLIVICPQRGKKIKQAGLNLSTPLRGGAVPVHLTGRLFRIGDYIYLKFILLVQIGKNLYFLTLFRTTMGLIPFLRAFSRTNFV